jgi:GDP-D-mannose 3',5'-epimerase
VADWARNEYFTDHEFCDEFLHLDLRTLENCIKASVGCDRVFNLAADMGGMGFIESNHSIILWNNTMISFNMLEAARRNGCKRFFYSSTACIYPEHIQMKEDLTALREDDAWLGKPQGAYGLEKLVSEEIAIHYGRDFPVVTRIARFHNIYGPQGTWKGGREKAPAAFCRKVLVAYEQGNNGEVEIWGDGKQTRSFCYIDDCIEGIIRIMMSDYDQPLNLGSDEMVSINRICDIVAEIAGISIKKKHISGPEGVCGRNSDNTRIKEVLNWAPSISLKDGIQKTYAWIESQIEKERSSTNIAHYAKSAVIAQTTDSFLTIGHVKN